MSLAAATCWMMSPSIGSVGHQGVFLTFDPGFAHRKLRSHKSELAGIAVLPTGRLASEAEQVYPASRNKVLDEDPTGQKVGCSNQSGEKAMWLNESFQEERVVALIEKITATVSHAADLIADTRSVVSERLGQIRKSNMQSSTLLKESAGEELEIEAWLSTSRTKIGQ